MSRVVYALQTHDMGLIKHSSDTFSHPHLINMHSKQHSTKERNNYAMHRPVNHISWQKELNNKPTTPTWPPGGGGGTGAQRVKHYISKVMGPMTWLETGIRDYKYVPSLSVKWSQIWAAVLTCTCTGRERLIQVQLYDTELLLLWFHSPSGLRLKHSFVSHPES